MLLTIQTKKKKQDSQGTIKSHEENVHRDTKKHHRVKVHRETLRNRLEANTLALRNLEQP